MKHRVVVAMSGGVDSSIAAWLLKERGYEVIGATMCIGIFEKGHEGPPRCCGLSDIEDARRVALQIGIPFHVFHLREEFEEIIQYFCEEYFRGRTPHPCILCNEKMKFGYFLQKAFELNSEWIATGHYSRLDYDEEVKRYLLRKGLDKKKDQSYVLFSLSQEQFQHTLFPLGEFLKEDIRKKAFQLGLQVYDKPESQEICFIRDHSYHPFLLERLKNDIEPGPIVDREGKILGRHKGLPFYTVGQRRGLHLAKGRPLYVIGINQERNEIIVGEEKEVYEDTFLVESVNWIVPFEGLPLQKVQVKIRYNHPGSEATLSPVGEKKVIVRFNIPQKAITPGQAAVFYHGDIVLGGGWIKEILPKLNQ